MALISVFTFLTDKCKGIFSVANYQQLVLEVWDMSNGKQITEFAAKLHN